MVEVPVEGSWFRGKTRDGSGDSRCGDCWLSWTAAGGRLWRRAGVRTFPRGVRGSTSRSWGEAEGQLWASWESVMQGAPVW